MMNFRGKLKEIRLRRESAARLEILLRHHIMGLSCESLSDIPCG